MVADDVHHEVGKWICSRHDCGKRSEIDTEMGVMCMAHSSPLMFALQVDWWMGQKVTSKVPHLVPWEFIKPHERQALYNHGGQSLARLSNRGGLSVTEALAVVKGLDYGRIRHTPTNRLEIEDEFLKILEAWKPSGS